MLEFFVLIAAIYLFMNTHNIILCAGSYALIILIANLIFGLSAGVSIVVILLGAALRFVLAYVYFWLLDRFYGGIFFWIILMVSGVLIVYFLIGGLLLV